MFYRNSRSEMLWQNFFKKLCLETKYGVSWQNLETRFSNFFELLYLEFNFMFVAHLTVANLVGVGISVHY